jgi:hypothetical protein
MMVAMASLVGFAESASANATVDLIWTGSSNTSASLGGSSILAASGDTITLAVLITAGTEGLSSYGVSVMFDSSLQNELNLAGAPAEFAVAPTVTCTPFPACFFDTPTMFNFTPGVSGVQESTTALTGFVYTFEAGTLGNGLLASFGAFQIGEITFTVNSSVATNGADNFSGFLNAGFDGAYDNVGSAVTMNFNSAAVNAIPEPGTAILLGLGLVSLAVAGRRKRS